MNTAILACKTLEDEVEQAVKRTNHNYPIYWIESGLHNYPEKLKQTLQQTIDKICKYDYLIMLFGLCGNALLGLEAKNATLVIPKVDDCISLFLGGNEARRNMSKSSHAYYLTKGWLRYENNIWQEYQKSIEKYGLEKTRSLFKILLKHYTQLVVIDTGAFDTSAFTKEASLIANELGLDLKVMAADLSMIDRALQKEWGSEFAIIKPGDRITMQDMGSCVNYLGIDKTYQ